MGYRYREAKIHAGGDSTAERLTWVLDTLNYAYNQFVWPYLDNLNLSRTGIVQFLKFQVHVEAMYAADESEIKGERPYESGSRNLPDPYSLGRTGLRPYIDTDALLRIVSVVQSESFDISLDGVGQAVEQIVRAIDPKARKEREQVLREREEELRHTTVMNAYEERTAQRDATVADVEAIMAIHDKLLERGVISPEEAQASIRSAVTAQTRAVVALGETRVEAIEAGDAASTES